MSKPGEIINKLLIAIDETIYEFTPLLLLLLFLENKSSFSKFFLILVSILLPISTVCRLWTNWKDKKLKGGDK